MLGAIFFKAQNKIQDPAKLSRLVQLIDAESWVGMDADTKGDLYEGLLQKNAEDTKSGAGQYFTPRALIQAMVACMRPEPLKSIADPACGTGGFFLAANEWLSGTGDWVRQHADWLGYEAPRLNAKQKAFLRDETFQGNEIVPGTRRLCLMNLFLHNIGELVGEPAVARADALIAEPGARVDYVLANPPFGKKSSMTITNAEGEEDRDALTYERQDFWETTSNKQLNFLQHIVSLLKVTGKAAVVLPDNVLFEGGAGERIRRKWLETCDVHTVLRLPTGIFYAQGVKANVVFFDARPKDGRTQTQGVWFYDLRTNQRFTLKTRPLKLDDLRDFVAAIGHATAMSGWRRSASGFTATPIWWHATRPVWIFSGSRTTAWTTCKTCRRPMCCSKKSSSTWRRRWRRFVTWRRACRRQSPPRVEGRPVCAVSCY